MAEGYWLLQLGAAQRAVGCPEDALVSYHRAAVLQLRLGDRSREALAWDGAGLAHRDLGRAAEAMDFHRRAASVHRELGDRWHCAVALCRLADTLEATCAPAEAPQYRREALALLGEFTDPGAMRLRERLGATSGGG
ncbi:hypothetical protein LN042_06225 [Kitasatospora sp. RB6PN24]|uniref:hypothetical protein n=1 Tax=Kitasatospora humi TaxID=2893891 RepID=UPI001E359D6B|nr:hypothetical protein [Kitasatospora humi]MCC9306706.1 hypothetical protein [Kitasatospora humi]